MSFIQQFFTSRDNNANAETFVGQEGRLWWDPVSNQIYSSDGSTPGGIPLAGGGGGNGSPGGSNSQVQFNNSGTFGGSANLTFARTTGQLSTVSISASGNITGNYFIGNGSQLTGLPAGYANSNVVAYGESGWGGNIIPTGNGVHNLGNATNQWGDLYVSNATIYMNNIPITLSSGNVLTVNGEALLSNDSNTSITTTGNITADYFVGNGAALTSIAGANVVGEVTNATYASSAVTAINAETVTANSQPNINSLGILTELSVTGNVTGSYFIGNGSQLTGISSGSSNTIFNGNSNVAIATPDGNVTITANTSQPYTWTFDTNGELLLAGNIVSSSNLVIKTNNDDSWISQAVGANGFSQLYWTSNISAANPYNGNDDFAWAYVDTNGLTVTSRTVEPAKEYNWEFRRSDGAFESPGRFITTQGNTSAIFDFHAQGDGGSSSLEFGADGPGSQYFYASAQDPAGRSAEVVLEAVDEGNLNALIRTSSGFGPSMQWNFTANGDLILPGDTAYIGSDSSRVSIYSDITTETAGITVVSGSSTNIFNEGVVNIETNSADVMRQWQFDQTGNLTIPGSIVLPDSGSIMTTGYNNPVVLTANADSNWAFGFSSDNVANYYAQVKFYGDNSATRGFKISDVNSANVWLFDGQGSLTAPGDIVAEGLISATGNIVTAGYFVGNFAGNITGNIVVPGSNTQVLFNTNGNVDAVGGLTYNKDANLLTVLGTVSAHGNVETNYFVGNGVYLSSITGANVTGTVANATYATNAGTVTTAAQPNVTSVGTLTSLTSTGNITGGNLLTGGAISATGNITGNYFLGNGSQLTGLPATYANANVAAYLASGTDTSNIITTANVSAAYFLGNGSQLTGIISSYGNANVVANLAALGSNPVSTTGNVTAGYFIGNGSTLTSVNASNVSGTVANATYAISAGSATTATSATTASTVTTAAQPNITSVGTLTSVTVTGNTTSGNLLTGGIISSTGNATVANITATIGTFTTFTSAQGGNVTGTLIATSANAQFFNQTNPVGYSTVAGYLSVAGNITGSSNIIGNGYRLTSINASNVTGTVANATYAVSADSATTAGTVTTAAQPNITSVGTLSSITVTANVTGGNLITGGLISAAGSITSAANISGGNLIGTHVGNLTGTTASLSGNVTGGNVLSNGQLSTAGNITGGNLTVGGAITAIGNISASYVIGAYYIGTWATNFQALGNISTVGNVISGNVLNSGIMSSTGNVTGGNLITTGAVYSNYNTNTANTGSFMATGGNTKGGTGYLDFLVVQNTSGGATVPYKWLRTTSDGQFQIINSAYTQNIFNLTDAGNVAIPGQLFINGAQTTNGPAFSAYAAAILQTIPNDTQTKVLFQTEEYDTNNCYANSRFTPNVAGYYQLNAEVRLDGASGTGEMMIILYKNGAEYKRGTNQRGTQIAANFWAMQVSSVAYANGLGDYFEIYVQQGSGGSATVTAVNNTAITWFNGCMLRGA